MCVLCVSVCINVYIHISYEKTTQLKWVNNFSRNFFIEEIYNYIWKNAQQDKESPEYREAGMLICCSWASWIVGAIENKSTSSPKVKYRMPFNPKTSWKCVCLRQVKTCIYIITLHTNASKNLHMSPKIATTQTSMS